MTTPPSKDVLLAGLDKVVRETLAYFEGPGRATKARVDRWQARDVLMHFIYFHDVFPRRDRVGHPVGGARGAPVAGARRLRHRERGMPPPPRAREPRRAADAAAPGPRTAGPRGSQRARPRHALLSAGDGRAHDRASAAGAARPPLGRARPGIAGSGEETVADRARVPGHAPLLLLIDSSAISTSSTCPAATACKPRKSAARTSPGSSTRSPYPPNARAMAG